MENPFLGLYEVMAEATKIEASFFIAKVKTPFPDLEIQLNDIVLDKDDLLIDKWIKDRNENLHTEEQISGSESHKHQITSNIQDKLKVNDKVILLNIGDKFIIISKVVNI